MIIDWTGPSEHSAGPQMVFIWNPPVVSVGEVPVAIGLSPTVSDYLVVAVALPVTALVLTETIDDFVPAPIGGISGILVKVSRHLLLNKVAARARLRKVK